MKSFSEDVKRKALKASHGFCMCTWDCLEKATEFHHKLANTRTNRKKYPLFVQSIFNCCPISRSCHEQRPPKIGDAHADAYEWYLRKNIDDRC